MDPNELKAHETNCRERRYECHLCGYTKYGIHPNVFRKHFALTHCGERAIKCMGCTETFSRALAMFHHVSDKHSHLLASICQNCFGRLATRLARNQHFGQCMKRRIECYICKMASTSVKTLRTHMVARHTAETKFKCHLCPRKYLTKHYLNLHIRSSHKKIGLVKCDYCQKECSNVPSKRLHEFRCKKSYECYLCKKQFPSFKILHREHMRTHLGERPYSCAHCNKTFAYIHRYNFHVMAQHLHRFRFQCNECKEIIVTNKDVNKHQKFCLKPIQKSVGIVYFKCLQCGLGLARSPELRRHILFNECKRLFPRKKRQNELKMIL